MFAPRNDIKTFYIQTTTCKNKFFDSPDTSHSPVNKLVAKATAFFYTKMHLVNRNAILMQHMSTITKFDLSYMSW